MLFACVALLTEAVLYSQNSLYLNNQWIVQKRMLNMGLMGADEFLLTRIPLAQNVLNLGTYFGYQKVIYKEPMHMEKVEFKIQLEDQSYLDFIYNKTQNGYSGLRLDSRANKFSMSFESTNDEQFASKNIIPNFFISAGLHNISLENVTDGLMLKVDGTSVLLAKLAKMQFGQIGFQNGRGQVKVDDLTLYQLKQPVKKISFRNSKNWLLLFFLNVGFVIILQTVLSRFVFEKFFVRTKKSLFTYILLLFVVCFCSTCWYIFDYAYYSKLTPAESGITRPLFSLGQGYAVPSIESVRNTVFNFWYKFSGGEMITHRGVEDRGYPLARIFEGPIYCGIKNQTCQEGLPEKLNARKLKSTDYRILFIGSSQTVGAGAEKLEDTFFVHVHKYLSLKIDVESINASVSGKSSGFLLNEYRNKYVQLKPDVVIINLSNNDLSTLQFVDNMNEFLNLNQSAGIQTLFLEEANSGEEIKKIQRYWIII